MSDLSFSFVDIAVVAIVLISAIYATYRGFVSETLSIFAWIAAIFAALYFGPPASELARGWVSPAWLAPVLGYGGVFLAAIIPLSFVGHRFSETVKHSPINTLDRSLGFVFGVVRGLAIVGLIYFVFTAFVPIKNQPSYVMQARTLPVIQGSSEVLLSLVPENSSRMLADAGLAPGRGTTESSSPKYGSSALRENKKEKSYGAGERRALDNLIEATGSGGDDKP